MPDSIEQLVSKIEDAFFSAATFDGVVSVFANILMQDASVSGVLIGRYESGRCQPCASLGTLTDYDGESFSIDAAQLDSFTDDVRFQRAIDQSAPTGLALPASNYDCIIMLAVPVGTMLLLHYDGAPLHIDKLHTLLSACDRWKKILHQLDALDKLNTCLFEQEKQGLLATKSSEHLARISHELRTPMSSVVAIPDMLESTGLNAEQKRLVAYLKSSGNMLVHIVNQVLNFSSLNMGDRDALDIKPFDLMLLLYDVFNALYPQAVDKRLWMKTILAWPLPRKIVSCRTALQHILMNIIGNCIKYTSDGGVNIYVRCDSQRLYLDVKDTGAGMNSAFIKNIFEPFHQERKVGDANKRGIGLGMTITQKYIELLEGNINIQSKVGTGTTFHVDIPIVVSEHTQHSIAGRIVTIGEYDTFSRVSGMFADNHDVLVVSDDCSADSTQHENTLYVIEQGLFSRNDPKIYGLLSGNVLDDHSVVILSDSSSIDDVLEAVIAASAFKHIYIIEQSDDSAIFDCISSHFTSDRGAVLKEVDAASLNDINVLVVEDHELNRHIVKSYLKDVSIDCDTAPDGVRAISMLNEKRYDLALIDLSMPDVSGFDVIRAYKDRGKYPETRFVVLTADVRHETEEKCRQLGVDDFLTKPIEKDVLLHAVMSALSVDASDIAPDNACVNREHGNREVGVFSSAIFDMDRVMTLMSDAGLFRELLTMWYENALGDLAMLREACDDGDVKLCRSLVHRIRSAAGNVCIHCLGEQTEIIEFDDSSYNVLNRSINFCNQFQSVIDKIQLMMIEIGWLSNEQKAVNR